MSAVTSGICLLLMAGASDCKVQVGVCCVSGGMNLARQSRLRPGSSAELGGARERFRDQSFLDPRERPARRQRSVGPLQDRSYVGRCSYGNAVKYGLEGTGVALVDVATLCLPLADVAGGIAAAESWTEEFATLYPRLYLFALERRRKVGAGPPIARHGARSLLELGPGHAR